MIVARYELVFSYFGFCVWCFVFGVLCFSVLAFAKHRPLCRGTHASIICSVLLEHLRSKFLTSHELHRYITYAEQVDVDAWLFA